MEALRNSLRYFAAQSRSIRDEPQSPAEIERTLDGYCRAQYDPKTMTVQPLKDGNFLHIANLLKHKESNDGLKGWSSIPRIYAVLSSIHRLDAMQAFIDGHHTDLMFPYSAETLPEIIADDEYSRSLFLSFQDKVLTEAVHLEKEGRHVYFKNDADNLFKRVQVLGRGSTGEVDKVYSLLSRRHYARKRFRKPRNAQAVRRYLAMFGDELEALKRLSHHHLVKMMGSYTDTNWVAYLMDPIADYNLEEYLDRNQQWIQARADTLRTYYGCLAGAVSYLHGQRIRHRDLKPSNILVKDEKIYIADFSAALDTSGRGRTTTFTSHVIGTVPYMPPEVARNEGRNTKSDMWSLGVVFLDMTTVLRGFGQKDMIDFFLSNGTGNEHVLNNLPGMIHWLEVLRKSSVGFESDNELLMWIKDLTQKAPLQRPSARDLIKQITTSASPRRFFGDCCTTHLAQIIEEKDVDVVQNIQNLPTIAEFLDDNQDAFLGASKSSAIESWLDSSTDVMDDPSSSANAVTEDNDLLPYSIVQDNPETLDDELFESVEPGTTDLAAFDNADDAPYAIINDSDDEIDKENNDPYRVINDSSESETTEKPPKTPPTGLDCFSGEVEGEDPSIGEIDGSIKEALKSVLENIVTELGNPTAANPAGSEQPSSNSEALKATIEKSPFPESTEATDLRTEEPRKELQRGCVSNSAAPGEVVHQTTPAIASASPQDNTTVESAGASTAAEGGVDVKTCTSPVAVPPDGTRGIQKLSTAHTKHIALALAKPQTVFLIKKKRSERPVPRFSASDFIRNSWESATVATSVMSEASASIFKGGDLTRWQDKTNRYLEYYAQEGKTSVVKGLLECGCNPGTLEKPRPKPLLSAVRGASPRHNKCAFLLLSHGANVNVRNLRNKKTALHYALENPAFDGYTNLIRRILEARADPNARDANEDVPLLQILYGDSEELPPHKRHALACLLQPHLNTDVNYMPPGTLNRPIHLAVRRQDHVAVGLLLERSANPNEKNAAGLTPLMMAVSDWSVNKSEQQQNLLDQLLQYHANINEQKTDTGLTALHIAISLGRDDLVDLLLDYYADPYIKSSDGKTAFHLAGRLAHTRGICLHSVIMKMLFGATKHEIAVEEDQCPISTAVKSQHYATVQALIGHGASPNHKRDCAPLLHLAVQSKDIEMVKLLVGRGASTSSKDIDGKDALTMAQAKWPGESITEFLCKHSVQAAKS